MKICQRQRRNENLEETTLFFKRMKKRNKKTFDNIKQIRQNLIVSKIMILLHDIKLNNMHIENFLYK